MIMGTIVAKQPNNLICRLSTTSGLITAYNMTENEYIEHVANIFAERGREEAITRLKMGLHPFKKVLDNMVYSEKDKENIRKILTEMGSEQDLVNKL